MYPIIPTTIKRKHMDKILSGEKKSEYHAITTHWRQRLGKLVGYDGYMEEHFVCGQKTFAYHAVAIKKVTILPGNEPKDIDGEKVMRYYEIELGQRQCNKGAERKDCQHEHTMGQCACKGDCILEADR